ncbi:MAG: hypothetical protein N2115_08660 [bacterium]|nr:hypothetical protein [bacterium]
MKKLEAFQKIRLRWLDYEKFDDNIFIILTKLGYQKNVEVNVPDGTWQIFCMEKETGIGVCSDKESNIFMFFAIWSPRMFNKKFVVSGMYEDLDRTIESLKFISSKILPETTDVSKKVFRFPNKLTVENALDYGYVRGLLVGIILMVIDITPWHIGNFRPQGILSMFLEYTRIVYYGTPGFAIVVGMAAIGIYFTVLFILLPIMIGNLFVRKAKRIERNIIYSMPEDLSEYDYGKDAEGALNDHYRQSIEKVKKEEIYKRITSIWKNIKKDDFQDLYEIFRGGLISVELLYNVLKRITETSPNFNLMEYLAIMIDVMRRNTKVVLKVSDRQEPNYEDKTSEC